MLVDRTGTFVTQREVPRLCLAKTAFERGSIVVSAPGAAPLELPRALPAGAGFERQVYQVWIRSETRSATRTAAVGSRSF